MSNPIPEAERTEIEAAAFRKLVRHLREISDPQAREEIYGMPYEDWKALYQTGPKQEHK